MKYKIPNTTYPLFVCETSVKDPRKQVFTDPTNFDLSGPYKMRYGDGGTTVCLENYNTKKFMIAFEFVSKGRPIKKPEVIMR